MAERWFLLSTYFDFLNNLIIIRIRIWYKNLCWTESDYWTSCWCWSWTDVSADISWLLMKSVQKHGGWNSLRHIRIIILTALRLLCVGPDLVSGWFKPSCGSNLWRTGAVRPAEPLKRLRTEPARRVWAGTTRDAEGTTDGPQTQGIMGTTSAVGARGRRLKPDETLWNSATPSSHRWYVVMCSSFNL